MRLFAGTGWMNARAPLALVLLMGVSLSGCAGLFPGSSAVGMVSPSPGLQGLRAGGAPKAPAEALAYADSLRRSGQAAQAAAVLENVLTGTRPTTPLLLGYARALAADGRTQQALNVIDQAIDPAAPDWQALMVKGTLLDASGNPAGARAQYQQALKIAPDSPALHANLGLSYLSTGELDNAEAELRRAAALPGASSAVRQNLALVLGLKKQFTESEALLSAELGSDLAAGNLTWIKRLVASKKGKSR